MITFIHPALLQGLALADDAPAASLAITFHPTLLQGLTLLVSVLLPIVVGLLTTKVTSPTVKALGLLALSFLTSVVTAAIQAITAGTAFDLWGALYTFGTVFIIGVAAHFGLWKPTGVAEAAQKTLRKAPVDAAGVSDISSLPTQPPTASIGD